MVCTANDLLGWNDFPKGLKVLLLDEDDRSAAEMKSRLEQMDYFVSVFCNGDEALTAVVSKSEAFHVAIIEVNASNGDAIFKFLENAKNLPTILTSNIHCLSTIMKCIALGAVEFLQKPLSDDKLRNIWQRVVHKAFNSGGQDASESLKPVKESVVSMLQLQLGKDEADKHISVKPEDSNMDKENNTLDPSSGGDKYPAPSTPQQKQGVRLVNDHDCLDQTNFSTERDSGEHDVESKSVETTCCNSVAENTGVTSPMQQLEVADVKEERESADQSEMNASPCMQNKESVVKNVRNDSANPSKTSGKQNSCSSKSNRKKMKVDWTPELHKKFVQAVEQLGVDQAIPSRILELMKVEGLTRHNVASHLQKYRMHRRHILPKEADRKWPNPRDSTQRSYYPLKPVMAFPPYHSNHVPPANQVYPAWPPPPPGSYPPNGVHMWGSHYYPAWQPAENWHWRPNFTGMHADAWGCPVMPSPPGSCPPYPQNAYRYDTAQEMQTRGSMLQNLFDFQPAEEVIDKVVKEAINKPWLPLPLGLKPPSTDSVLNELTKQGISKFPPNPNNGSHIH